MSALVVFCKAVASAQCTTTYGTLPARGQKGIQSGSSRVVFLIKKRKDIMFLFRRSQRKSQTN